MYCVSNDEKTTLKCYCRLTLCGPVDSMTFMIFDSVNNYIKADVLCMFCSLLGAKIISGVIIYGMAIDYWSNHLKQQPKSARKRHKSGKLTLL